MARSLRDLRRKMKAIRSTRQVTKAMELVAASKMRRAVQNAQMLRRYALTAWNILERIASVHPDLHPYLTQKPAEKILAILFTPDRGLCGPLNAQLFREVLRYVQGVQQLPAFAQPSLKRSSSQAEPREPVNKASAGGPSSPSLHFIAVGRKGQQFLVRTKQQVIAAFPALSNHPTFSDVLPISRMATESFLTGAYDHVVLLYTDFRSALVQEPTVKVLLPFSKTELKEMLESLVQRRTSRSEERATSNEPPSVREYLFEPSQGEILRTILPQLTEAQVYQAVLEAAASEHSARMVAMRNATDNASDMLDDLTLTANQTRQANITAEIAELSASKAALEA